MKKLELVKAGIGIIVTFGVGTIVGNAIKATTPGTIRGFSKIAVALGGFILTGIASDMAVTYTEDRIDDVVEQVNDGIKKISDEIEENEIEQ